MFASPESKNEGAETSGKCGFNLTWSYDESCFTLTISGTGQMNDYEESAPWSSWMSSIKTVIINEGAKSIGDDAFYGASNLTRVTIPEGLSRIGSNTFCHCESLRRIKIPSSVSFINQLSFQHCHGLEEVEVESSNPTFESINGVLANKLTHTLVYYPGGRQGSYVVPSNITTIGEFAFLCHTGLTEVTLPSVTSISFAAFQSCKKLTSVLFKSNLTSIGENAFSHCEGLPEFTFPHSVTTIGNEAFFACNNLTSVTLPKNLDYLGKGVFAGCQNLISIEVETSNQNYQSVNGTLVEKNTTLIQYPCGKEVQNGKYTIPSTITTVAAGAFQGCKHLLSVTIHDKVKAIRGKAFQDCSSLTSMRIPSTVTEIGSSVFRSCNGLKSVSYDGSNDPGEYSQQVFEGCNELTVICVPENYSSSTFSGRSISCKSDSCELIQTQINHCYDAVGDGNECIVQKSAEAIAWEESGNECYDFECLNDTGIVISKERCKDQMICLDDKCINAGEIEKEWTVVIDIDSSNSNPANLTEVKEQVSAMTNVSLNDFEVSVEYNTESRVVRIIVYVDDKTVAILVKDAIDNLDKGEPCEGVLCDSKETHVQGNEASSVSSSTVNPSSSESPASVGSSSVGPSSTSSADPVFLSHAPDHTVSLVTLCAFVMLASLFLA